MEYCGGGSASDFMNALDAPLEEIYIAYICAEVIKVDAWHPLLSPLHLLLLMRSALIAFFPYSFSSFSFSLVSFNSFFYFIVVVRNAVVLDSFVVSFFSRLPSLFLYLTPRCLIFSSPLTSSFSFSEFSSSSKSILHGHFQTCTIWSTSTKRKQLLISDPTSTGTSVGRRGSLTYTP